MAYSRLRTLGPDFICIGAQKAGTSWLHWNLLFHPATSMPPEKEVNFFYPPVGPWWQRRLVPGSRRNKGEWSNRFLRWEEAKRTRDTSFPYDWYKRYLFASRSSKNYTKLFPKPEGLISGDISPGYAAMPAKYVAKIARAAPAAKIIYLLRNPVDRKWSEWRMNNHLWNTGLQLSTASCAEIVEKLDVGLGNHDSYLANLGKWEHYFPGRVKVWFYDQLCENQSAFFTEVCDFLEIPVNLHFDHNKITERVHEGISITMPENVRRYLSERMKGEIADLHRHFGNHFTQRWLDELLDCQ